ncbi:hypothetical protein T492DRAFT_128388 [Pavlovales sp. CCMP2436]|nr:hypothetical protein T492DRAFT_128388 [Pavlovales sp. CCMP2436]
MRPLLLHPQKTLRAQELDLLSCSACFMMPLLPPASSLNPPCASPCSQTVMKPLQARELDLCAEELGLPPAMPAGTVPGEGTRGGRESGAAVGKGKGGAADGGEGGQADKRVTIVEPHLWLDLAEQAAAVQALRPTVIQRQRALNDLRTLALRAQTLLAVPGEGTRVPGERTCVVPGYSAEAMELSLVAGEPTIFCNDGILGGG